MTLEGLMQEAAGAFDAGDMARAEPLLRQIVGYNPRDAKAWHALALITCRSGRSAEALDCAMQAHKLDRRNHLYLNTIGVACVESGRTEESLRWFRRALKEKANHAESHYNIGKALKKLEQFAAAEQAYRSALRIDPSMADAENNLATLYIRTGRFGEALTLLESARVALHDSEGVAINTGLALFALSGPDVAIEHLSRFLERHPDSAEAHYQLALLLLSQRRFAEGWHEYAWRHRVPGTIPPPGLAQELAWDLRGRDVVLLPNQGLGDQLFFLRFAALVRDRGARVHFAAPEKLLAMLKQAPGLDGVFSPDLSAPPEFSDATIASVGDLPRLLGGEAVPPPFAVVVPPERIVAWRSRLAALGPPPYLGVTWRAGTNRQSDSEFAPAGLAPLYKEIQSESLASAVRGWHGTVLVLQRLPIHREIETFCKTLGRRAHDLSAVNDDLADMAALLSLIDEYVGVSNTNMHVRAAIGRTARVLVPFPPEFRWLHSGSTSPWFPGFTTYRQSAAADWTSALSVLSRDLTY